MKKTSLGSHLKVDVGVRGHVVRVYPLHRIGNACFWKSFVFSMLRLSHVVAVATAAAGVAVVVFSGAENPHRTLARSLQRCQLQTRQATRAFWHI